MGKFIFKRLLAMIPVLLMVAVLIALAFIPGLTRILGAW